MTYNEKISEASMDIQFQPPEILSRHHLPQIPLHTQSFPGIQLHCLHKMVPDSTCYMS